MTNPTATFYRSPRPRILRAGEVAEIARFTRAALAAARSRRGTGRSTADLDDLAESIDGWSGSLSSALAMHAPRMTSPAPLAADQLRRTMHLDSAADRVIARATSDLDERTYQHQRAYGIAAAAGAARAFSADGRHDTWPAHAAWETVEALGAVVHRQSRLLAGKSKGG